LAAGFGTVRRFNAGIRQVYQRTPTQIRRLARQTVIQRENQYVFRLGFRPPYDWKAMLAFLSAHATPGVESVGSHSYTRSISLNGCHGYVEVSIDEQDNMLDVRLEFDNPRLLFFIVERIRAMFDLNADWEAITKNLRMDPFLRPCVEAHPGLRVPGCWSGFELATRAVLGQNLSAKAANALAGRIVSTFGQPLPAARNITHLFPMPEVLASADLSCIGISAERAGCLRDFARAICDGRIRFEGIADSTIFLDNLCQIPGIDRSTAEYLRMRTLREPDAFPFADRDLLRASSMLNPRDLDRRAESWRPWRAYAAMYLWSFPPCRIPSNHITRAAHLLAV